jgi:hypothetical protein
MIGARSSSASREAREHLLCDGAYLRRPQRDPTWPSRRHLATSIIGYHFDFHSELCGSNPCFLRGSLTCLPFFFWREGREVFAMRHIYEDQNETNKVLRQTHNLRTGGGLDVSLRKNIRATAFIIWRFSTPLVHRQNKIRDRLSLGLRSLRQTRSGAQSSSKPCARKKLSLT